jgi:hypothetical protein
MDNKGLNDHGPADGGAGSRRLSRSPLAEALRMTIYTLMEGDRYGLA